MYIFILVKKLPPTIFYYIFWWRGSFIESSDAT